MKPSKITYTPKSFSVDPTVLGMVTPEELEKAQGVCFADFMRRMEREVVAAMGIPKEFLEARSRREQMLRDIMGEEYVEDADHAPEAFRYWQLIAS